MDHLNTEHYKHLHMERRKIRSKTDNLLLTQQPMGPYFDMSQFPQGMPFPVFSESNFPIMNPYGMGFDPN